MFPNNPFGQGQPRPGQGMNAMAAMMGGLGQPPTQQGPPPQVGPNGLPFGGSMPGPDADAGGSDFLSSLLTGPADDAGDGGDPYGQPPGSYPLDGVQAGDPKMGLQNLLEMLALAQGGAGGNQQGGPMGPLGGAGGGMMGRGMM